VLHAASATSDPNLSRPPQNGAIPPVSSLKAPSEMPVGGAHIGDDHGGYREMVPIVASAAGSATAGAGVFTLSKARRDEQVSFCVTATSDDDEEEDGGREGRPPPRQRGYSNSGHCRAGVNEDAKVCVTVRIVAVGGWLKWVCA
jgi:hypothetical protein